MHFVSCQKEHEQINDIVEFLTKNIDSCVNLKEAPSNDYKNFHTKINQLNKDRDYKGILSYLLTIKKELLTLPISHKVHSLTI